MKKSLLVISLLGVCLAQTYHNPDIDLSQFDKHQFHHSTENYDWKDFKWENTTPKNTNIARSRVTNKVYFLNEDTLPVFNSKKDGVKMGVLDMGEYGGYKINADVEYIEYSKNIPFSFEDHGSKVTSVASNANDKLTPMSNGTIIQVNSKGRRNEMFVDHNEFINKATVWNFSFGIGPEFLSDEEKKRPIPNEWYTDFFNQLSQNIQSGKFFVWATGNGYRKQPQTFLKRYILEKYNHDGVIAITSLGDYANHCGEIKEDCITNKSEFKLKKTNGGNEYVDGTSMASPDLSAFITGLKSIFPFLTNKQIKETVLSTADDIGQKGVDERYGVGLLNKKKALGLMTKFAPNTVFDLSIDKQYAVQNAIYTFSNYINGGNAIFKNSTKNELINMVFGGSVDNIRSEGVNMNIDGDFSKLTLIAENAKVSGQGRYHLLDLTNGELTSWSPLFKMTPPLIDEVKLKESNLVITKVPLRVKNHFSMKSGKVELTECNRPTTIAIVGGEVDFHPESITCNNQLLNWKLEGNKIIAF